MSIWTVLLIGYFLYRFFFSGNTKGNRQTVYTESRQRASSKFELNLLSLASIVIKSDGIVNQKELDFVRLYFVQAYGKERANTTFKVFNEEIKKKGLSTQTICNNLRGVMRYESLLQVLHFLFSIAKADGFVSEAEVQEINRISGYFGINYRDFESIKAMFFSNPDSAYKILEIDKNATTSEIKKAYRTMVKKYHPDKLQHMDEVYRKGAEEKFRKVQEAYEQIQKERGF
jgi:DnaJ like chaperone protein